MKGVWIPVLLIAILAGSVFGLRSCQRAAWESFLWGPYTGTPFAGEIAGSPISTLPIRSRGRLEVYEVASKKVPVLVLRSQAGVVQWSRLLLPERRLSDGSVQTAGVRDVRLERLERDNNGYGVLSYCEWEWGGKEGGLIDVDREFRFKSFRLSW